MATRYRQTGSAARSQPRHGAAVVAGQGKIWVHQHNGCLHALPLGLCREGTLEGVNKRTACARMQVRSCVVAIPSIITTIMHTARCALHLEA